MKRELTDKPWGYEILWAKTNDYVGKTLCIKQGHRLSLQYHETKEESIFVVSGRLKLHWFEKGDTVPRMQTLVQGESFHIPPRMKHRFEGIDNVVLVEVSTPHLGDVVRLEDDYGRLKPQEN